MHYTSKEVYEFISRQTSDPIVERKTCAISGQTFAIFQSDLDFYNKISPTFAGQRFQIPTPTLCPEERQRRRLMFRNERKLYKRKCDATGDSIIARFSPDKNNKIFGNVYRSTDKRDQLEFGFNPNFNETITDQLKRLTASTYFQNLIGSPKNIEYNAQYTNHTSVLKNCYYVIDGRNNQDCYYSEHINECNNVVDCANIKQCNHCYDCIDSKNLHNCISSKDCTDSNNLVSCIGLRNCSFCYNCQNLQGKLYYIENKSVTREYYAVYIQNIPGLGLHDDILIKNQFNCHSSENIIGDYIFNSNNCIQSFDIFDSEDCKYSDGIFNSKNLMDVSSYGEFSSVMYEGLSVGKNSYQVFFSPMVGGSEYMWYCMEVKKSRNCFGCVNMKNVEYCIFNKQYTKEEYETTVAKIITHMQETGERGEFFHPSLSPFGYNETVAQEYFPLTREEVLSRGYQRQDNNYDPIIPEGAKVIDWRQESPTTPRSGEEEILKSIFICEVSGRPYKIIKQELEFYRKHHLPLPKRHPDIRHEDRMKLRPGRTLYLRNCDKCGKEMLSVYPNIIATSRKSQATLQGTGNLSLEAGSKKIYCEECYQQAVYG